MAAVVHAPIPATDAASGQEGALSIIVDDERSPDGIIIIADDGDHFASVVIRDEHYSALRKALNQAADARGLNG